MARDIMGDEEVFAALTYGMSPTRELKEFTENSRRRASEYLNDTGRQFYQKIEDSYQRFINSDHIRVARAALRRAQSTFMSDTVRPLNALWEIQNAPICMLDGIMAEPTLRKLYHGNRCDGFSDRYKDDEPGKVGEEHTTYRRITNGMIEAGNEDSDFNWQATTHSSTFDEAEDDMDFEDQVTYKHAWITIQHAIKAGKDPSSVWDEDLG